MDKSEGEARDTIAVSEEAPVQDESALSAALLAADLAIPEEPQRPRKTASAGGHWFVAPVRWVADLAQQPVNWLAASEERVSYRPGPTLATDAMGDKFLLKGFEETTKEARNLFVLHVSVVAYSLLTLGGVRDEDFYGSRGTVQLAMVNVQVPVVVFFLAAPLLAAAEAGYLHVYLGYARRFYRLLVRRAASGDDAKARFLIQRAIGGDEDKARLEAARDTLQSRLQPWIATLAESRGPFGALVRKLFLLLANCGAPAVAIAYWLRLLRLDTRMDDLSARHLPPMVLAGVLAFATTTLFVVWAATRRTLDARLGLGEPISTRGWLLRMATVGLVGGVCLPSTHTHEVVCERWRGPSVVCGVNLEQAVLSRPPKDGVPVLGALLAGVHLRGANLRGAYLDGADFRWAHLEGSDFQNAHLEGAHFDGAQLQDVNMVGAELQGAGFAEAQLNGANLGLTQCTGAKFSRAQLQCVNFGGAQLQGAAFDHVQAQGADFRRAQVQGASFAEAGAQGADFGEAQLEGAFFPLARLQGADFALTSLLGANFAGAQLQGAVFGYAWLQGALFFEAQIQGADFTGAVVKKMPERGAVQFKIVRDTSHWPDEVRQSLALWLELDAHFLSAIGGQTLIGDTSFCSSADFPVKGGGELNKAQCDTLRCAALREAAKTDVVDRDALRKAAGGQRTCAGVVGECGPM